MPRPHNNTKLPKNNEPTSKSPGKYSYLRSKTSNNFKFLNSQIGITDSSEALSAVTSEYMDLFAIDNGDNKLNSIFDNIQDAFNRFRLHENGTITVTKRNSEADPYNSANWPRNNEDNYHKTRVESGKKTKSYSIDSCIYRKIASSSVRMWKQRKHKIASITLTFPGIITEKDANICFSKYIDNLEHTYHLNAHIAVLEIKNGRWHYHCMFDIPFIHVKKLNGAWCHAFSEYFPASPNALRLGGPNGTIVHSVGRMVNYMCKYMTKVKDQKFSARCYFISHNITSRPKDINYHEFQTLLNQYKSIIDHYDYCTIVTLYGTSGKGSSFWDWFTESYQNQVDFPLKTCFNRSEVA